ncbi:hypothetical protein [Bacillus licheniformis]|uniref:hypothetical protein n=1 Tax=Bacillus licheniformis TaxID=1402 RepID=UPI001E435BC0|nr:hypothetical protein [Bacillus licheniformis]
MNIAAEYLDIEFMETMDTMLHEMVHLYNAIRDIQDCSRNGTYHNKDSKLNARGAAFTSLTTNQIKIWMGFSKADRGHKEED